LAAKVATLLVQEAVRHCTVGKVQAIRFVDEHEPWHTPLPAQAPREPCGWPDVTGMHVPWEPLTSHASQLPLHALLQQNPSTQKFELHSEAVEHIAPFGFLPHDMFTQLFGATHSLVPVHVVAHAELSVLHLNGAQVIAGASTQLPWPSHFEAARPSFAIGSHVDALQTTSYHSRQFPAASQVPSRPHVLSGWAMHES
jgi:hypothetical protein